MAYRERLAWLHLLAMALPYSVYFPLVAIRAAEREPTLLELLLLFGITATTHAVITIVGMIVLATRGGSDARVPADERDRAIARRGAAIGYYVLPTGMIVVAQLANSVIVLLSYRRGWHG